MLLSWELRADATECNKEEAEMNQVAAAIASVINNSHTRFNFLLKETFGKPIGCLMDSFSI